MINAIGIGRLFFLIILLVVFSGGVFFNFMILSKKIENAERGKNNVTSILSSLEQKTVRLQDGFKFFQKEKDKYYLLNQQGFFDIQGRFEARQRFEAILQASDLLESTQYNLKPAKTEVYDKLTAAGYQILSSDMELELNATTDLDIFKYLFYLTRGFPGVVTINSFEMSRAEDITQPVLRKLGTSRQDTPLVKAKVYATWRSATQQIEGLNTNEELEAGF